MSAPDIVLHIGMQQSGATMLQRALSRLRPQLRAHGVAYVGHNRLSELDHIAGWDCHARADRSQAAAFERKLAEAVEHERRKTAGPNGAGSGIVLLSSDHLVGSRNIGRGDAGGFRPRAVPAITQVIKALGGRRVALVLYTHRQDRLMEFCYLREIQKGRHHRFARQFPYRFEPVLDYTDLIERLRAVPGVAEVLVRPFELVGVDPVAFVDDFLDVVGLKNALDLDVLGTDLSPHHVYSRRGLKIALAMNPHLDTVKDRRLVRDFLLENFAATDDRQRRFIPKRVRQQILDTYQVRNRYLFRTFMPDLPEDTYASNEATARLSTDLQRRATSDNGSHRLGGMVRVLPLLVASGSEQWPPATTRATGQHARPAAGSLKEMVARLADRHRLVYRLKLRYLARRCDAFLVSFPKCGRTWLRVMLGIALSEHFGVKVRNLRRFTNADVRHPGVPRVLATHDDSPQAKPADQVIGDKSGYRNTKVILLVRDPRDVVVSLYFHVTRRRRRHYDGGLSDFIRDPVGSLASLLAFYDAWAARFAVADNLLLVRYEDLRVDPGHELRRVLAFLGLRHVSDATVTRAIEGASFEVLQRLEGTGTAGTRALRTDTADDPESYKLRRGKVGGFVDYLGPDDISYLDACVARSLGARDLGYAGGDADGRLDTL